MRRTVTFPSDDTALPRGSRVIVKRPSVDTSGGEHRAGILAVVKEAEGTRYTVETPGGTVLVVERADLALQKEDLLAELALRQWDHRRLREHVIYAAVVGSRAWGLHRDDSDEDVRGCFVLPFQDHASIYDAPDEIHDDERQEAHWEIEKLVRQALRADPNTLETLWSPLPKLMTPLGKKLVDAREIFSSRHVVGSFGRYAQSQLQKLERAKERARNTRFLLDEVASGRIRDEKSAKKALPPEEDVHALVRALFDRGLTEAASFAALAKSVGELGVERLAPEEVRPKNAYNLVRLLHSCMHWLAHGTPLIRVDGALKDELLAIKEERTPLEDTLRRAQQIALAIEDAARGPSPLRERPDVDAADALVREVRRHAATRAIAPGNAQFEAGATAQFEATTPVSGGALAPRWFPVPLPPDVELGGVRRFLEQKLEALARDGRVLVVGLTGAHAYGFPSPDSDLDLKAIHTAPARELLGLRGEVSPLEVTEIFEGREMDLSSHELGQAAHLLLKGNGNMLERLLGPMTVVIAPLGEQLAHVAKRTLSCRVVHHYRGFLHAMKRESDIEARDGRRTAKRLLYAYRVALTGTHLLLEGELVTDVRALAPLYGFGARVDELIVRKKTGELSTLSEAESAPYLADWEALSALLDEALTKTRLPAEPAHVEDLEALMIEARLSAEGGPRERRLAVREEG